MAVVGGQGEGTARTVLPVTSSDYDVTANNIEFFVNATDVETTDGLTARGNKALAEKKIKDYFTFEVLQTPTCQYGVHYFLGDLVSAINPFTLVKATYKVMQVTVVVDKAGNMPEKVDIELVKL